MEDFKIAILLIIILTALVGGLWVGLNRTENAECRKWQNQAEVYPDYYITSWQELQCNSKNIRINAPVK